VVYFEKILSTKTLDPQTIQEFKSSKKPSC